MKAMKNPLILVAIVLTTAFLWSGCSKDEDLGTTSIGVESLSSINCTRKVVYSAYDLGSYFPPNVRTGELNKFLPGGNCHGTLSCPGGVSLVQNDVYLGQLDKWCSESFPSSWSIAQQDAYIAQAKQWAQNYLSNVPNCPNGQIKFASSIEVKIESIACICPDYSIEPPHLYNTYLSVYASFSCCKQNPEP